MQILKIKNQNTKQVVVLGAGFAGLRAALVLAKKLNNDRIVLVDHRSYHTFHADLYEVATAVRVKANALTLKRTVAIPIADIVSRRKKITFKQAWVANIDLDRKIVRTDGGDLIYDALVVALGSVVDYYDISGLTEHGLPLKTFDDAVRVRNHIEKALAEYARTRDESFLNFIIGGGGFTGVELAGELMRYIQHLLERAKGPRPAATVWLIEGANQLLPGFPAEIAKKIQTRLESLGVKIKLNCRLSAALADGAVINHEWFLPSRTIVWTGGVRSCQVPFLKNIATDKKNRVVVSSRLNLENYPEVFVAGDDACWLDRASGQPEPQTAQVALHQAEYVAAAIVSFLKGRTPSPYRPIKNPPFIIPLSGKYAALVWHNRVWMGWSAYLLRRMATLRYLLSVLPPMAALTFWFKGSLVFIEND